MKRYLEIYWIIYFLTYMVSTGLLLWEYWGDLLGADRLARTYLLGALLSIAAGVSIVLAIIIEAGGFLVLLIPARVKQLKNEGREEGLAQGLAQGLEQGREQGRQQMSQRYAEAIARFGYTEHGRSVLPFTPEVQRFLNGEDVIPPPPPPPPTRRYGKSARTRRR